MTDTNSALLTEIPEMLTGPRIVVRPYRAGDGDQVWEAIEESREHIQPWLPWGDTHRTRADSEAFVRRQLARWITREDLPVGIWDRQTGRYLGGSGLHRIDWTVPSFEIGYWLRRSAQGHGYMSEAVRLLCALAFETLKANRVFIRCAVENHRSRAIPERLGFVYEGPNRSAARDTQGRLYDMLVFGMTPPEYAGLCAAQTETMENAHGSR